VPTHEQILQDYHDAKQDYQNKTQFFSFLLFILVVAYLAVNYWEDIRQALGNSPL
jgi:hypothetical protein